MCEFIKRIALAAVLLLSFGGAALAGEGANDVLYIYTRQDYFDPEAIKSFEERYNCRVEFDYYDSKDTMYEKIRYGDSGYDLVMAASLMADRLDKQGLLQNLDRTLIPNLRHLDTTLIIAFPDLEMRYHAPYTWSVVGIGYNQTLVPPEAIGGWDIFEMPGMWGRGALINDERYVIGAALLHLGYSPNTVERAAIDAAVALVQKWKESAPRFGVIETREMLGKKELAFIQGYNGDIAVAERECPDVRFYVPKEGSLINSDCFIIPFDAASPKLAHAFINHMFDPDVAARNMERILYYMPNHAALRRVPEHVRQSPLFSISREILSKCHAIRDTEANDDLYEEAWEKILFGD